MFRKVLNFFLNLDHQQPGGQDHFSQDAPGPSNRLARSGMVTATIIVALVAASIFAYYERGRGNLTKIQRTINSDTTVPTAPSPMPGGMAPIVLSRSQMIGETGPQFLSATLLPGRGMNIFQITAYIPGKGEISLLASPTLDEAAQRMTDQDSDRNGALSLSMGGAPMAPWAGSIPSSGGGGGDKVSTLWQGRSLHLPTTGSEADSAAAIGGLLLDRKSDTSDSTVMPDGSATTLTFHAGDFDGHWPSATDVNISVLLSGRIVDLTISARNIGSVPEPMGIGWQPRFALLGKRSNTLLHIPATKRIELGERGSRLPTGHLLPVEGTPYDLRARTGAHLPTGNFEATYTDLITSFLDDGPLLEMTDATSGYGLRLKVLSTTIHAVHVAAPSTGDYVVIAPQFNLDDPFGREWSKDIETGMKVLQPGQAVEWKVQLELFDPRAPTDPDSVTSGTPQTPGRR